MFVVVEDLSFVNKNGEIVQEGVTVRQLTFDNIQAARDLAMSLTLLYGTREEGEVISDYQCSYVSCGQRNFSKFSVAKLETVE